MRRAILCLALGFFGCSANKDPKIPGDQLGTYHVIANLDTSTCGPGALGSTDVWEFDVKLSRDGHELYWLNGSDPIAGSLAADDVSFSFATQVVVNAVPAAKGNPGCTIARADSGSGQLSSSASPVDAFAGTLRYGFQASQGSDCQSLMGVQGGFYTLPCEMNYQMKATRSGD